MIIPEDPVISSSDKLFIFYYEMFGVDSNFLCFGFILTIIRDMEFKF